jgi:hypothetical protein
MLVHHLHMRPNVAGWPKVQKHGKRDRMIPIDSFELWRHSVGGYLAAQSDIQERWPNREIAFVTERICLNASDWIFLNG